jgi:hypothetical protein
MKFGAAFRLRTLARHNFARFLSQLIIRVRFQQLAAGKIQRFDEWLTFVFSLKFPWVVIAI